MYGFVISFLVGKELVCVVDIGMCIWNWELGYIIEMTSWWYLSRCILFFVWFHCCLKSVYNLIFSIPVIYLLLGGLVLLGMIRLLWEVDKMLYEEVWCGFCAILIWFIIIGFGRWSVLFICLFSVQYGLRKLGDDFFVFFSLVNGLLLKFVPVCLCVIWLYYFEGDWRHDDGCRNL